MDSHGLLAFPVSGSGLTGINPGLLAGSVEHPGHCSGY